LPGPPEMDELTKKEEMEDEKSARRAPPLAGASFSQDRGRRCNSGNFPKEKIPGLVVPLPDLSFWSRAMGR